MTSLAIFLYQKCDSVRGIGVCGLYAYAGYMRENAVLNTGSQLAG